MAQLKTFFNSRLKTLMHCIQLILVIVVIGLSAARVFMKNQPRTRANTISLGMASKSLVILQYQLLTEHMNRFRRWASLKAYAILNGLEVLFWAAVVFLMIQANIARCVGLGCTLSWVIIGLAVVLTLLAIYVCGISFIEFRESKRISVRATNMRRGSKSGDKDSPSEEEMSKSMTTY